MGLDVGLRARFFLSGWFRIIEAFLGGAGNLGQFLKGSLFFGGILVEKWTKSG